MSIDGAHGFDGLDSRVALKAKRGVVEVDAETVLPATLGIAGKTCRGVIKPERGTSAETEWDARADATREERAFTREVQATVVFNA